MKLPETIPSGTRIVVRTFAGTDSVTKRTNYRDYVGHVRSWDGKTLDLLRDAAANGSRPAQRILIQQEDIAVIKPIPERPF
ncbi:MAG: hypothetical protein Q3961_01175 [Bifidobacteriaceae bacterium]|nr:hypothetical protein [Bifidobacteriaceae bacterium]